MNRTELVHSLQTGRAELLQAIEGLDEADLAEPGVNGAWSVKDVLAHLTVWEAEMLKALGQARMGKRPTAGDLTEADVDRMNARFHKETARRPLDKVMEDLAGVRAQTLKQVERLPDEDLHDPGRHEWLHGQTLAAFIAGDSFEHERDHIPAIVAWRQSRPAGATRP